MIRVLRAFRVRIRVFVRVLGALRVLSVVRVIRVMGVGVRRRVGVEGVAAAQPDGGSIARRVSPQTVLQQVLHGVRLNPPRAIPRMSA